MTTRRSQRRGGRRGAKGGLGAVAKVSGGTAILAALAAVYWFATTNQSDPVTHCKAGEPAEVRLVLVDASDPLDGVQAERVKGLILSDLKAMPTNGRIDIYVANTSDGTLQKPEHSLCNPGAPNQFTGVINDAEAAHKAFEEGYLKAVEETMAKLLEAEELPSSPIIESLRSAATSSFARLDPQVPVHITVISDMVQNSALLRQRASAGASEAIASQFDAFAKSTDWPRALVDLHRADLRVVYVSRPKYRSLQGAGHLSWWEQYFDAVNGGRVTVDTI